VRIVVVNCNTSQAMTEVIAAAARVSARPGTSIVALTPTWGVPAAEGFYDSFLSAAAVLDLLGSWEGSADAVVLAGFGEHGREGARQLLDIPVVDITEAAAVFANLVAFEYGVVTTTRPAIPQIRQSLASVALLERCVGVRATGLGVLDLDVSHQQTVSAFTEQARTLIDLGAEAIVLGCAGVAGLQAELQAELGVPVIDGVSVAISLCEDLVHHRLSTSKVGAFSPPNLACRTVSGARIEMPAISPEVLDLDRRE
jgi:allantoin racemase